MKKFSKLLALALSVMMLATTFAGCGSEAASSAAESGSTGGSTATSGDASTGSTGKITKNKLVLIAPLTGNNMQYGVGYKNSCEMAVEKFNEAGGVDGVMIEFEALDDKGDQKEAINLVNKVAADPTVFAIVGSYGSSVSMAMAPVCEEYQIPLFTPNASNPDFPPMSKMIVSLSATQLEEQEANSTIFAEDFGMPKVGILYQNTDNGVSASTQLTQYYTEKGGTIVESLAFTPNGQTKDFTPYLSKLKAAGAEAVFVSSDYADAANILLQRKQVGMDDITFLCQGQVIKVDFFNLIGDRADGLLMTGGMSFMPNLIDQYDEQIQEYIKDYNERYGEGACDGFAANGYDCANMALYALKNVGDSDPLAICDEARKVTCPIIVSGNRDDYWYDENNVFHKGVFTYIMDGATCNVYERKNAA